MFDTGWFGVQVKPARFRSSGLGSATQENLDGDGSAVRVLIDPDTLEDADVPPEIRKDLI